MCSCTVVHSQLWYLPASYAVEQASVGPCHTTACTRQTVDWYLDGFAQVYSCFHQVLYYVSWIEIDNYHMLCISRMWTIDDRHSGYKFLIPIKYSFKAEQCTRSYEVHLLPHFRYPNAIIFHRDSWFMSDHFQAWTASKGILLQPSPAYHQQPDSQTEIVNKEVVTVVHTCELEGDQSVKKLPEIQQKLNSRYNSSCGSSPFHTLCGFTPWFGQAQMPYAVTPIVAESDRHA